MVGRAVTLDDQNLYIFRGLRLEFRLLVATLTARKELVTLAELSDFLVANEFICGDEYVTGGAIAASAVMVA